MENASDALIMAGSMLLFVFALTVAISSLTNVRMQTQEILSDRDQLMITTDNSGEYINFLKSANDDTDDAVRVVGIETVITSVRRMTKEDYTIYIDPLNNTGVLKKEYDDLIVDVKMDDNTEKYIKIATTGEINRYVSKKELTNVLLDIHSKLYSAKFKEYIGTYQKKADGVADINKTTYKIITYKQIS